MNYAEQVAAFEATQGYPCPFLSEQEALNNGPFCPECNDWHQPDEPHSAVPHTATDGDGNVFTYLA